MPAFSKVSLRLPSITFDGLFSVPIIFQMQSQCSMQSREPNLLFELEDNVTQPDPVKPEPISKLLPVPLENGQIEFSSSLEKGIQCQFNSIQGVEQAHSEQMGLEQMQFDSIAHQHIIFDEVNALSFRPYEQTSVKDEVVQNDEADNPSTYLEQATRKMTFSGGQIVPNMLQGEQNNRTEDCFKLQIKKIEEEAETPKRRKRKVKSGQFIIDTIEPRKIYVSQNRGIFDQSSKIVLTPISFKKQLANHSSMTHLNQDVDHPQRFLQMPIPTRKMVKCSLRKQKECVWGWCFPKFTLYSREMRAVIRAQKNTCFFSSNYIIQSEQKEPVTLGYLQANFIGSTFNLYRLNSQSKHLICTICYSTQFSCTPTFRRIEVYLKKEGFAISELLGASSTCNLKEIYHLGQNTRKITKLVSKAPILNGRMEQYQLDLRGKCKYPSVNNMILEEEGSPSKCSLLFCKIGEEMFYTQISQPLSPFTAMGIMLTSLDFKLCCQ